MIINSNKIVTRPYNSLVFNTSSVVKGAPEERYKREVEWFKEATKRIQDNIPFIYDFDKQINTSLQKKDQRYYEMQLIEGQNLYQWATTNKEIAFEMFDRVLSLLKIIHSESLQINNEDIHQMYYLKPKKALLDFMQKNRLNFSRYTVNGVNIDNPIDQLDNLYNKFKTRLIDTKFSFIHGDLTMSNIVVTKNREIYLIDPRGCFGNTALYGDIRYDIAKLYYSIIGNFDSLNNGQYNFSQKSNNEFSYLIIDNNFAEYKRNILEFTNQDEAIIDYIHTSIWLSLIPHVFDNLDQQWCTFCHSIFLLNTLNTNER